MAIYTPTGLAINLSVSYTFALMQRLYPKVDAFKVLKTTEGLESMPAALAFVSALVCFFLKVNYYQIALYPFVASLIGTVMTLFGLFLVPGLALLGTLYSYVSGSGILFVVLVGYGLLAIGWRGVLAFFVGRLVAGIVNTALEFWNTKRIYARHRVLLHLSELNFLNAYRLHASETLAAFPISFQEFSKRIDTTVSEEELKEENWKACFDDLALTWPEVVRRFTDSKTMADKFSTLRVKLRSIASRPKIAELMSEFGMTMDPNAKINSLHEHFWFLRKCGLPWAICLKGLSKPKWFRLSLKLRQDGASEAMIEQTLTYRGRLVQRGSSPIFGGIIPWIMRKCLGF